MEREQFTFYRSYYEALKKLSKRDREQAIMAICAYALDEEEIPLSGAAAVVFLLVKPTLDTGRKRASSGKQGGSKPKANVSKCEAEEGRRKKEVGSRIQEVEDTPQKTPMGERFDRFWASYPNKTGKQAALKTWSKLKPSAELTESILAAVEYQKTWDRWTKDGGRYIPNPATWLNQGRWEDEPPDSAAHTAPTDGENYLMGINPDELEGIF